MIIGGRYIICVLMTSPANSTLPQSSRPLKVAFGPFEFDPASGNLRKNGYKVKLPGQPGEILSALTRYPGEVVTREDLRSFDVSADGSRFVIPSITPGDSSALVVLQDWESLVAK